MKYLTFSTFNCHLMELQFFEKKIQILANKLMFWTYDTSWIRSLVTRAPPICSTEKLPCEINIVQRSALRNDCLKSVVNSIIN